MPQSRFRLASIAARRVVMTGCLHDRISTRSFGVLFGILLAVTSLVSVATTLHDNSPRIAQANVQVEPTATAGRLVLSTSTADPTPISVSTIAPTSPSGQAQDEIAFEAGDWVGGFVRDDAEYYGRPWTAIYGAQSDYPSATLTLVLANDPDEPVTLVFDGLDDELPANNRVAIEINGQRVYEGESWFENWDGLGRGENAQWTTVEITIPADLLIKGRNRVTVLNLTDGANFSSPPYILLSTGTVTSTEAGLFGEPDEVNVSVTVVSIGGGND
jgi:hypothetical protein